MTRQTHLILILSIGLMVLGGCAHHETLDQADTATIEPQLSQFTMKPECVEDPDLAKLQQEVRQRGSILHLLKHYMNELETDTEPDSPALKKLDKLFACGQANDRIEGYHYGITVYLRAGEHPYGGFLNQLWGESLADASPWDGKSFTPMSSDKLSSLTEGAERGEIPTFIGINGFKTYDESLLNRVSMAALTFWLDLQEAPESEQQTHGYHKKGGHFIAHRAKSISPRHPGNDVFQLNYRWKNLKNPVPIRYLVDEIVQIADGLYFGPLLFATQRLLEDYNPELDPGVYRYENFGYFLLLNEEWVKLKEMLFP